MIYDYLKRGVVAGVIAGLAYGMYIALVANPLLNYIHDAGHDHDHGHAHDDHGHGHDDHGHAHDHHGHGHDDHGHAHDHAAGHDHSHAVSETTNAIVSVGSAVLWGILLAAVFALAYYFLEPALPGRDGVKAAILGAAGFFSVSVTPWLVLPPAAPGGEEALGIDARLAIYVGMIGLGLVVSAVSITGYRRLAPAGRVRALAVAAVPVVLTVAIVPTVAPPIITQPDVANELVYAFLGSTFLSQAALWAIIVGAFVRLQDRAESTTVSRRTDDDLFATP